MTSNVLIVGCGFAGATSARMLADAGIHVTLLEKRPHVGGNAHDRFDEHGVLIHEYGPHIFHTNSKQVFEFLSRFTDWRFYEHRVLAEVDGKRLPIPINRTTINALYDLNLDEAGVQAFLEHVREPRDSVKTSADVVLSSVGADLCDKFFRGYTKKQWGLDLEDLSAGVAARIPTRTNEDDRYFTDTWQFMPSQGYTAMFLRMLDHPLIQVRTSTSFEVTNSDHGHDHLIYTGPIDAYFDFSLGRLPYRSLRFEHQHLPQEVRHQEVGTINFPLSQAYTRITEFKHLTGQTCRGTSVVFEYPQAKGDPYYPIPRPENEVIYKGYAALAESILEQVTFVGRLAQYRYYNMDQVTAAAMSKAQALIAKLQA